MIMKYYLVTETEGKYHIDYVWQALVAAESLEDAYNLTHYEPIDYIYTEDDVRPSQMSKRDELCQIQSRAELVKKLQENHDSEVDLFKKTTVELNIPCTSQIQGVVQEMEPVGGYYDF